MQMVKYFEDNFGEVPDILKSRWMPNDPFLPSMENEFKSWLKANHNKWLQPGLNATEYIYDMDRVLIQVYANSNLWNEFKPQESLIHFFVWV